jgi:hypothetical protein
MASNATLAWSNIVAALGAAIVSTLVTAWYFRGFPTATGAPPSGATGKLTSALGGLSTLAAETITYIPHILLLFGVLADMFTLEGVYSIPSLVGLLSIPLNYLMKYFWDGLGSIWASILSLYNVKPASPFNEPARASTPAEDATAFSVENPMRTGQRITKRTPRVRPNVLRSLEEFGPKMDGGSIKDYDGCDVQGFEGLHNAYAPQTLVVTATVFMYYIFDLIMNRGWRDATASIVVFFVLYTAEAFIIGKCGDDGMSPYLKGLIAYIHGLIFGGAAYGVVSSFYPTSLPSRALPDFPRKTASNLTQLEDGTYVDENNTPWIVLPNGNAIPSMCEGGLGALLGDETGTGEGAVPGSCPSGAPAEPTAASTEPTTTAAPAASTPSA